MAEKNGHERVPGWDERFRAAIIRWTLAYWAVIYILFTVRSLVTPRPYLLAQAGLRGIMMVVGITLCIALFAIVRRVDTREWPRRLPQLVLPPLLANLVYMTINYWLFYGLAGLWVWEYGPISRIAGYVLEFFWLFPAWMVLYVVLRQKYEPPIELPRQEMLEDFWIRSLGVRRRVPASSVNWLESEGDYVRLHTAQASYLIRSTMARLEEALDPSEFIRIHRRIMISKRLIEAVVRLSDARSRMILSSGETLPIGRHYLPRLRDLTAAAASRAQEPRNPAKQGQATPGPDPTKPSSP